MIAGIESSYSRQTVDTTTRGRFSIGPRSTRSLHIHRLPFPSFGKQSLLLRIIAAAAFAAQAFVRGLFVSNLSIVLVSTSPPVAGIVGVILSTTRGVPLKYWLMDLNPEQVVALNRFGDKHFVVRLLRSANRFIFARASDVIVLDRFMRNLVARYESSHLAARTYSRDPTVAA